MGARRQRQNFLAEGILLMNVLLSACACAVRLCECASEHVCVCVYSSLPLDCSHCRELGLECAYIFINA